MKMVGLRDLTREELLQKKHELTEELFNLRMRKAFKELDNPLKLRTIRREIAKIETILSEDRLGLRRIVEAPVSILDSKAKVESTDADDSEKS
jgi:large subunit ribosomal protein L29